MEIKKVLLIALSFFLIMPATMAQAPGFPMQPAAGKLPEGQMENWEISIVTMDSVMREKITETMTRLEGSKDRSVISDVLRSVLTGGVSGIVEVLVQETYNLAQYRSRQKQEWMRMIQNENNYTDSITSIKNMKDFYKTTSMKGALDPSDINFDGIEIRGMRDGEEMIYLKCSIDKDKLDNLFNHSKFNLVLDTMAFYPYRCHLPNVTANGIKIMKKIKKGKDKQKSDDKGRDMAKSGPEVPQQEGDTIIRPGAGGNMFSFDERNNLNVNIDFSIFSSWINEAVQVHKNVELGNFRFNINIPGSLFEDAERNPDSLWAQKYTYGRKSTIQKADSLAAGLDRNAFLAANLINVEGDSFVVPRSFMPINGGTPMWGTGEYNIKVKIRESCQLANDSEKAKHWRKDYKQLREMQNRSGEIQEYFKTLWNQYGNNLVKTTYRTALSTAANDMTSEIIKKSKFLSGSATSSPSSSMTQMPQTSAGSGGSGADNPPTGAMTNQ